MVSKVKVLIVDDSSFMRNVLARMIEKDSRFEVVGKATNGAEGVEMVKKLNPDLVTMDIEMPVMSGLEALGKIMSESPRPVVMVSSLTEEGAQATLESLEKGAVDFIPKALQDKDRNIFQSVSALHDKLYAASQARVGRGLGVKQLASTAPSAHTTSATSATSAARPTRELPAIDEVQMRARRKEKFPTARVLLIASSTGGPRALQEVVPNLPANLSVPVILAQHMPANFTKAMASRLNACSPLEVKEAAHGDILKKGHVYLAPGGLLTKVERSGTDYVLKIEEDKSGQYIYHPSVDALASSVADTYGGSTLAVMLTGMGSDGSKEYARLRKQGAYTIAQDEASSVVFGMPKSVIAADGACEILALGDVANALKRLLT